MNEALWEYVEKCSVHSMKMKPIMTIATDKAVPASGAIQNSVICFPDNVAMMLSSSTCKVCMNSKLLGQAPWKNILGGFRAVPRGGRKTKNALDPRTKFCGV